MSPGEGSVHPRMSGEYPSGSPPHSGEQKGLKESAQEMAARAAEAAGQWSEKGREFASGMQGRAEEAWHGARERFSDVAGRAETFWDDATMIIRRYPIAALSIAFGLGCMTTLACSMRSHHSDMTDRMSRSSS